VRKPEFLRPEGSALRCSLCPHACLIKEGAGGICGVRRNSGGLGEIPYYGRVSSLALDPVEKKPLYHFKPGKKILSAGFLGCNMRCPFCQNWEISQDLSAESSYLSPEDIALKAADSGGVGLAYTYSEPLIHIEYLLDAAKAVRSKGLLNVIVTNGFASLEAADALLPLIDGANIDLKSFNPETYRKTLGGDLEAVKAFIARAASSIHVELTTLIVPGMNEGAEEMDALASWVASISRDIPLHVSAYRPAWNYDKPPTGLLSLSESLQAAKRHLRYVYSGNVSGMDSDTRCPVCGAILIRRLGYQIEIGELEGNRCTRCGARIPLVP
jgi:pyruvate formate lyase activating enzyme